ncbi:DUF4959 domain-containing protein [Membranicola marinus]|uniref:DUF4959 domain-containing protein n=1 Tax=Membranihabitans marinus TaxID=1227546 RepID=A0A953HR25_9BACT|nr:DUF5000 domain-containing lipoprotein [Membranihabitans marinus]MBY5956736.1 DUF4959 domain-containing protein [Membranihabitans marinus]
MKRIRTFIFIFLTIGLLNSCDEDEKRPLVEDSIPPGAVTNIEVENLPGGARISYTLPPDKDVLYVEASFTSADGKLNNWKSSVFNNSIEVAGFPDTVNYTVELRVVDQSENRSAAVNVDIQPLTPPITLIAESIKINPDFGGIGISWVNENQAEIAVIVEAENEVGELEQVDIRYSSQKEDNFAVRGFDTIPRNFAVFIRDRYDNLSTRIETTIKPLFEQNLDKNLFNPLKLPHDAPDAWGWVMTNLFNNNIGGGGFHTPQGWTDDNPTPEYPEPNRHFFTLDLGVTAQLSRFKFWQRQGSWLYYHGNPRYFDVWGASELTQDGTFDGWTKLISNGEVLKPSGLPLGQVSNDDVELGGRGHEYIFPLDAPKVRYIRFVNLQNWSGSRFMHIMEMDFWGEVQ